MKTFSTAFVVSGLKQLPRRPPRGFMTPLLQDKFSIRESFLDLKIELKRFCIPLEQHDEVKRILETSGYVTVDVKKCGSCDAAAVGTGSENFPRLLNHFDRSYTPFPPNFNAHTLLVVTKSSYAEFNKWVYDSEDTFLGKFKGETKAVIINGDNNDEHLEKLMDCLQLKSFKDKNYQDLCDKIIQGGINIFIHRPSVMDEADMDKVVSYMDEFAVLQNKVLEEQKSIIKKQELIIAGLETINDNQDLINDNGDDIASNWEKIHHNCPR